MKVKTIALVFAACAAVAATTSAFASSAADTSINDQTVAQASQWATGGKAPKGKTRAQVRAELIRFEQAGYHSANGEDPYYPADVEAVTAKLQAPDGTTRDAASLEYGGSSDGRSQTGSNIVAFGTGRSIYFGR